MTEDVNSDQIIQEPKIILKVKIGTFVKWQPTPVPLTGKSHGWRSLVCYSPWGRKELDMTEWLQFPFLSYGVSYGLVIHGLYYIEIHSLYTQFVE